MLPKVLLALALLAALGGAYHMSWKRGLVKVPDPIIPGLFWREVGEVRKPGLAWALFVCAAVFFSGWIVLS